MKAVPVDHLHHGRDPPVHLPLVDTYTSDTGRSSATVNTDSIAAP